MNNQNKLQWKKLSNTSVYRRLFDKENQDFLQNILSHKITEFEIDNLPSCYIISFIQVLQNYIYYYIQNNKPNSILFFQNNDNDNENEDLLKNMEIEQLNKKIIEYQEIINKKDKLLNDTNIKLISLYNQYCKLEKEYNYQIDKYKKEIKNQEENLKETNNQFFELFDTFEYLTKLYIISNEGNTKNENEMKENKLNKNRTFNNENKMKSNIFNKQFSSNIKNNILRKINTERK